MKTLGLFIAFIISNVIVQQSIYFSEAQNITHDVNANFNVKLFESFEDELKLYYLTDFPLSSESASFISEIIK